MQKFVLLGFLLTASAQGMDQNELVTTTAAHGNGKDISNLIKEAIPLVARKSQNNPATSQPASIIAPEIQEEIGRLKEWYEKASVIPEGCSIDMLYTSTPPHETYRLNLRMIVTQAGDKMSKQAKLNHLLGDDCYNLRKTIIKEMVDQDRIHPDTITYNHESALNESILHKDFEFTTYLLQNGATVTEQIAALLKLYRDRRK